MKLELIKNDQVILEKKDLEYQWIDETLKWNLDDTEHSLNLTTKEFTRENKDYLFYLDLLDEKCEITLKNEGYYLQVQVEYANLLKNKNVYELIYRIETDDEEIKLRIELEGNHL